MENDKEEENEETDYVVDVKQTFYANFMWLLMLVIIGCFVFLAFGKTYEFQDETTRLLYLIVMMFSFIKLLSWIRAPRLMLRQREKHA